jgi:hypothetical protein
MVALEWPTKQSVLMQVEVREAKIAIPGPREGELVVGADDVCSRGGRRELAE